MLPDRRGHRHAGVGRDVRAVADGDHVVRSVADRDHQRADADALERKLYVIRRIVEIACGPDFYAPSFSIRTCIYKGMLLSPQVRNFFPDLKDERFASALALGTGVVTQVLARRAGWGPRAGIVGALLAAGGFVLAAVVDHTAGIALFVLTSVVLGSAYGLCLRAGLLDVETLTPAEHRGAVIGIYYVCTYLGFGLPVLIEALRAPVGTLTPYVVLSAAALLAAGLRTAQLRRPAQ